MKTFSRLVLCILLACFCCSASAQMFKCRKENGTFNYQPEPCAPGVNEQLLDAKGHVPKPQASAPAAAQGYPEVGVTSPEKPLVPAPAPAQVEPAPAANTAPNTQSAVADGVAAGAAGASFIVMLIVWIAMFMLFLLPLKISATLLKTGKTGWWACFIAGFAGLALSLCCFIFLPSTGLRALSIFVSALAFVVFLQTNYWRGLVISAVAFVFYVLVPQFAVKKLEHMRQMKEQQQANFAVPATRSVPLSLRAAPPNAATYFSI